MIHTTLQTLGSTAAGSLAAYALGLNPKSGALIGLTDSIFRIVKSQWDGTNDSAQRRRMPQTYNMQQYPSAAVGYSSQQQYQQQQMYPLSQSLPPKTPPSALGAGLTSVGLTHSASSVAQFMATYFGHALSIPQIWMIGDIANTFASGAAVYALPIVGSAAAYAMGINYRIGALIGTVTLLFKIIVEKTVHYSFREPEAAMEGGIKLKGRAIVTGMTFLSAKCGQIFASRLIDLVSLPEAWVIASITRRFGSEAGSWLNSYLFSETALPLFKAPSSSTSRTLTYNDVDEEEARRLQQQQKGRKDEDTEVLTDEQLRYQQQSLHTQYTPNVRTSYGDSQNAETQGSLQQNWLEEQERRRKLAASQQYGQQQYGYPPPGTSGGMSSFSHHSSSSTTLYTSTAPSMVSARFPAMDSRHQQHSRLHPVSYSSSSSTYDARARSLSPTHNDQDDDRPEELTLSHKHVEHDPFATEQAREHTDNQGNGSGDEEE